MFQKDKYFANITLTSQYACEIRNTSHVLQIETLILRNLPKASEQSVLELRIELSWCVDSILYSNHETLPLHSYWFMLRKQHLERCASIIVKTLIEEATSCRLLMTLILQGTVTWLAPSSLILFASGPHYAYVSSPQCLLFTMSYEALCPITKHQHAP